MRNFSVGLVDNYENPNITNTFIHTTTRNITNTYYYLSIRSREDKETITGKFLVLVEIFLLFEKRKEGRTKKERRKGGKSERKFVYFSKMQKKLADLAMK